MFDLEQSIAEWRQQMLAAGIKTPVPLDELESHLRDDVERQVHEGLGERQAFEIAVERIGQASCLKAEFKKATGMDESRRRKRAGLFFASILGFYSLVITCVLCRNDLAFNERVLGFAAVAITLFSVYVVCRIIPRLFPVIANKTVQSAVGIVGSISGMSWFVAFAYLILPRLDFTQGQLLVAVLWAIIPVLVFPTASFLVMDKSERQQLTTTSS
jgi:hypothetical protein